MHLTLFAQDTIQCGFGGHIAALIQLVGDDIRWRSAAVLRLVTQAHHRITFLLAVFLVRCRAIRRRTLIRSDTTLPCPPLIRADTQVQYVVGWRPAERRRAALGRSARRLVG